MSQAKEDVAEAMQVVADAFKARGPAASADQVLKIAAPSFVTLILERLDNIEREIRFANEREVR